jgi:Tfp pilus assembly protein PilN
MNKTAMNEPKMNAQDMKEFETQMRDVLRRSERELDTDTVQHLAQARSHAMNAAASKRRFFMPVTGMALASVVALVLVLSPNFQDNQTTPLSNDEMLLSEGIDLYEDMDFYYWLASENNELKG